MNNQKRLIKKYKPQIVCGERNIAQIWEYLKERVDLSPMALEDIEPNERGLILKNISTSMVNEELKLSPEDFQLRISRIVKNEKSRPYYQCRYLQMWENPAEDCIFVLAEAQTGYIHSNSNKLQLELLVAQGISEYDYVNETMRFVAYLSYLDFHTRKICD